MPDEITEPEIVVADEMPAINHEIPPAVVDPMIAVIERVAMDPAADIEKLERMLAMKERLDDQASRKAFDAAMAAAKAEIPPILKTGVVDYTNKSNDRTYYQHETLAGIAAVVDPILGKFGLSYRYRSKQENGALHVTCVVAHKDGWSEETTLQGAPDSTGSKNNYQAVGSAVTYLQRYTLKLALGLSAAPDDDAKAESDKAPETITSDQFIELRDLLEKAGVSAEKLITAYGLKPDSGVLEEFLAKNFESAKKRLISTIKTKNGAAQ